MSLITLFLLVSPVLHQSVLQTAYTLTQPADRQYSILYLAKRLIVFEFPFYIPVRYFWKPYLMISQTSYALS